MMISGQLGELFRSNETAQGVDARFGQFDVARRRLGLGRRCEPVVFQITVDVRRSAPRRRIGVEELPEQFQEHRRKLSPERRDRIGFRLALPARELGVVGIGFGRLLPWKTAGEHAVEKNAHGPDVGGGVALIAVRRFADLRRRVRYAAADAFDVSADATRHAEVDQEQIVAGRVFEHEILWLDVAMNEFARVRVFECRDDLRDVAFGLVLRKADFGTDCVEEIAAGGEVLDENERVFRFEGVLARRDDVTMSGEHAAVLELLLERLAARRRLVNGFDGHFRSGHLVESDPGRSVGASTHFSDKGIALSEAFLVAGRCVGTRRHDRARICLSVFDCALTTDVRRRCHLLISMCAVEGGDSPREAGVAVNG